MPVHVHSTSFSFLDEVTVHMSNEGENNGVVAMTAPDKSETSLAEKLATLYKKTKWFQE